MTDKIHLDEKSKKTLLFIAQNLCFDVITCKSHSEMLCERAISCSQRGAEILKAIDKAEDLNLSKEEKEIVEGLKEMVEAMNFIYKDEQMKEKFKHILEGNESCH